MQETEFSTNSLGRLRISYEKALIIIETILKIF